jgi:hypothetical protein
MLHVRARKNLASCSCWPYIQTGNLQTKYCLLDAWTRNYRTSSCIRLSFRVRTTFAVHYASLNLIIPTLLGRQCKLQLFPICDILSLLMILMSIHSHHHLPKRHQKVFAHPHHNQNVMYSLNCGAADFTWLCCLVLMGPMYEYFANLKDGCENNAPHSVYWLSAAGTCKINWHWSPFVTYAASKFLNWA